MNITEISDQKHIAVIVQRVELSDLKNITKKEFFFRWDQLKFRRSGIKRSDQYLSAISYKKLLKQHTPEELVESFVFPVKYTVKQQEQANRDLAEARKKSQAAMTEEDKIALDLYQLRFQLEDYLKGAYKLALNFGHFLDRYLKILNKKKKEFAAEIQIRETLLSHLISNRREPNNSIMIRLELHANKIIPAILWYKLAEKGKEHQINTDNSLREKERPFVTQSLQLTC